MELDTEKMAVYIDVFWPSSTFVPCPECQSLCPIRDHKSRLWRHLDTMQMQTFLRCEVPRAECLEHGALRIHVPWSDKKSRFTSLFSSFACQILLSTKNQTKAAELLGLGWKQIHRIKHLAVEKALFERKEESLPFLGADEKSFLKGHKYMTLAYDLQRKKVLEVVEGRDDEASEKILDSLSEGQKEGIKAVAMDMWKPYKEAVSKHLPHADIVHDRFHISAYLGKAMDKVRRQ